MQIRRNEIGNCGKADANNANFTHSPIFIVTIIIVYVQKEDINKNV